MVWLKWDNSSSVTKRRRSEKQYDKNKETTTRNCALLTWDKHIKNVVKIKYQSAILGWIRYSPGYDEGTSNDGNQKTWIRYSPGYDEGTSNDGNQKTWIKQTLATNIGDGNTTMIGTDLSLFIKTNTDTQ